MENTVKPGWYKHFKGGIYEVVGTAMHSETLETLVLYKHPSAENPSGYWVRPIQMFNGNKIIDGKKMKRFVYLGETKPK